MPSTITAEKAALRKSVKETPFAEQEKIHSDRLLFQRFLSLPQLAKCSSILLYHGVGREPDTAQLFEPLYRLNIKVALPRCLPGGRMEARRYLGAGRLSLNPFGIPEPDETCPIVKRNNLSLILVPGLCFDVQGFRLGHGGGYYDRYLAGFSGVTVALCRERFLFSSLPVEPHDRPVELVLTETRCLSHF